ncbi:MAG: PH domain-containing protein [Corynebacteriales bacterium]|nr:PH domain-containing protein [Mycobacteriales bacterium]
MRVRWPEFEPVPALGQDDVVEIDKVIARPYKTRWVCWSLAITVVVLFSVVATALRGETEGGGNFHLADQLAMVGLGFVFAGAILLFTRPRVIADSRRIQVRNIIGSHELEWALVRRVRFDDRSPWVTLDLADDDTLAVMAVQVADKGRAVEAVRGLRRLLEQSRAHGEAGV